MRREFTKTRLSEERLGALPVGKGVTDHLAYYGRRAIFSAALLSVCLTSGAQQHEAASALQYDAQTRGPVPIPPSERNLQTVVAQPWFKVSDTPMVLEGACFDRNGNLLFTDVYGGRIFRLASEKKLSVVFTGDKLGPGGLAIHKDGRIFITGVGDLRGSGSIVAIAPDGSTMETIVPVSAGYLPNDLVFDRNGGFYFSDFRGTSTDPRGGVYYVSPDLKTITPVLPHISEANGIALSPDGNRLWTTEFGSNRLLRTDLESPTQIATIGTAVPYYFTGAAPDSTRADSDGNVYVAMYSQGRVLVFNHNGIPIGQVLLPGRDEGHNLQSTSMAIKPGTNDIYIVTNDGSGGQGATIFHARVFAKALLLYSQE
jgi:lactonase